MLPLSARNGRVAGDAALVEGEDQIRSSSMKSGQQTRTWLAEPCLDGPASASLGGGLIRPIGLVPCRWERGREAHHAALGPNGAEVPYSTFRRSTKVDA